MTPDSLTPSQWAQVSAEFALLADAGRDSRSERLEVLARTDAAVAREVRSLLSAADADDGMLERLATRAVEELHAERSAPLTGRTLGPWTLTREIGRGGMGVVYEGRRAGGEFDKRVAIKTLAMGVRRPELLWRFRRERQILAGLSHPNITTLFDGGTTDDGVPYLVMEYVDGTRIDAWCDAQQLALRARLDLFRTVCGAVQFAHSKLIVHRDLKPGNIMVTNEGVVKLLDFGVAKLLAADDTDADTTRTGLAPLTTAYASPEQARGEAVTTSSDVYALGVLLYRLLTGVAPHDLDGRSAAEVMELLSTASPRLPSASVSETQAAALGGLSAPALRRALSGELDAIVMKALRKDPERRYLTVQALSDDVLRYLKSEPVTARPERLWYTVRAFARRNRAVSVAAALALVSMLAGTGVSLWQAHRATAAAARATRVRTVLESILSATDPLSPHGIRAGGPDVPLRVVLDSAVARVAWNLGNEPQTRADLYRSFATSFNGLDRLDEAMMLADSARTLHARVEGAASLDVAIDETIIAVVQWNRGDADAARRGLESLRDRMARDLMIRDSLGAVVLGTLAQVTQGNFYEGQRAAALAAEAIRLELDAASPKMAYVATLEALLAMTQAHAGRAAASDSSLARAFHSLAADAGRFPAGPMYVASFAGGAEFARGRLPVAEGHMRRAVTSGTQVFGARHALTATVQSALATVLLAQGKLAEAKRLADSALATQLARAHRNPRLVLEAYRLQASIALVMQDTASARGMLRLATAELPRLGGTRPHNAAFLDFVQAGLAMQAHDTLTAWRALHDAATITRDQLGAAHPVTTLSAARLAEFSARFRRDPGTGALLAARLSAAAPR
jgi:eukaryotic-like serine/threonine-protein kinase